ncbi:spore protease YyaC [Paenibacillus sp. GCM10012307]|uniref:Spore protease YyaC n=1 Tax=Paenibacillus roseus TaxID=2798579 RepID=A0A934J7G2_9BACL|nr:spore protease YyaC [Paenibacillus roseus]MBJ6361678.1 spore protease YyaC [Paenibacillus roseus]
MKLASSQASPFKIASSEPNVNGHLMKRIRLLLKSVTAGQRIAVVCIGTDRSTGDALGPLVGTALTRHPNKPFDVYGTLESPVHAMNLEETMAAIKATPDPPFIIGIDACLGQVASVGSIQVGEGPVRPGAGVNKQLPPVGDMHITGIVNVGGFMEYFVLQNTRLHLVMQLSEIISFSLFHAILSESTSSLSALDG